MAEPVRIQHANAPLGVFTNGAGKEVPILITREWYRSLEILAREISKLQARIDAAGIPEV